MAADFVARGVAAQAKTLAMGRKLNKVAVFGDSRHAAIALDPSQFNKGTRSPINWVNAMLGQRLTIGKGFGVSGERTDQMRLRMGDPLGTDAGILHFWGGINNIGAVATGFTYVHAVTGETITISTVARSIMEDVKVIVEAALAIGMQVIIENEVGGQTLSTTEKVAALNDYRQMLANYVEGKPGVMLHDAQAIVMQPSAATPTFKTGYSYDGTHLTGLGAYWHAKSLMALFDRIAAPRPIVIRTAAEVPANGRRQLLANPIFTTTTGGTAGNGITGDVPSGWTAAMGTNVGSTTLSSVTNTDGVGNGVQAAITYNAAGSFTLTQSLSGTSGGAYNANLRVGDEVEGFAVVEITAAFQSLSALALELTGSTAGSGGTSFGSLDMTGPNAAADKGVNDTVLLTLRTKKITIPAATGTFPYLIATIRALSNAAGSGTIVIRQIGVRRIN